MSLRAALDWQIEAGVIDAIGEASVDRYAVVPKVEAAPVGAVAPSVAPGVAVPVAKADPVADARRLAAEAGDLAALQAALAGFEQCDLRRGARNLVFAEGVPGARVMIIGEAPGREEDREGKPFVGAAGRLLDRMLEAIGLRRDESVYITNVLPWRPPQNRDPLPGEIAMMRPFVERHVALAAPEVVVLMGNIACDAGLGRRGISRLRGQWGEAFGKPALPMFHPEYLIRQPHFKREAWADLLALRARLG
ncbi:MULTISPECIES: uracil-DNA glycosylase [unclassified Marinovum]